MSSLDNFYALQVVKSIFSTRIMLTVLDMTDTKGPYNQQTYYNETEQILKC